MKFRIAIAVMLLLFVLDLVVGSVGLLSLDGDMARHILLEFRLPKALTAALAGAALGASGLMMQTIFRNPLAGPYVLGVSSGASLGVALLMMGLPAAYGVGVVGAAWVGAGMVFLIVAAVSRRIGDIMAVLIIGMMLGSVAGAAVEVLQYFGGEREVKSFVVWTMGSLGGVTASELAVLGPVVAIGLIMSMLLVKGLDGMMLGENYARTMGVGVGRVRGMVFLCTTLLAGTVTAFCGPIGFLGLAVPHIARMVWGTARHAILMPASIVVGAAVMLGCDIVAGTVATSPLPINTITALVGIPVVIMVVMKNRQRW